MNKIDEIKHSKLGGRKYIELTESFWQGAREEGRREGTDEAIIKLIPALALSNDHQAVIKILMKTMNLSQAQAEKARVKELGVVVSTHW